MSSVERFFCLDCGVNTQDEYYMLHNHVWNSIAGTCDGMLCVTCVEQRLNRDLCAADFSDVPLNHIKLPRSASLVERMSRGRP